MRIGEDVKKWYCSIQIPIQKSFRKMLSSTSRAAQQKRLSVSKSVRFHSGMVSITVILNVHSVTDLKEFWKGIEWVSWISSINIPSTLSCILKSGLSCCSRSNIACRLNLNREIGVSILQTTIQVNLLQR